MHNILKVIKSEKWSIFEWLQMVKEGWREVGVPVKGPRDGSLCPRIDSQGHCSGCDTGLECYTTFHWGKLDKG